MPGTNSASSSFERTMRSIRDSQENVHFGANGIVTDPGLSTSMFRSIESTYRHSTTNTTRQARMPRSERLPDDISPLDTGNIRAICYTINNGYTAVDLASFLDSCSPSFEELESTLKLYREYYSIDKSRRDEVKKVFKEYAEKTNIPARKKPCFNCKKEFIYWNLATIAVKPIDSDQTSEKDLCSPCYSKLSKHTSNCDKHMGVILLGNPSAVCPLYPKKCRPKNWCTSLECLHQHMQSVHKGYAERRWRSKKKFLSTQSGRIIKSDIMTGVEFEVVGKNKQSSRINSFKLSKAVGIDHDSSLHDEHGNEFYLATEIITPPASGKKYEDLIEKVSAALVKDGFVANDKCGLHIHIDLFKKYGHINLNPNFYKGLLAAYVIFEDNFFSLAPVMRQKNPNVRFIYDKFSAALENPSYFLSTKFSKIWYRTDNDRHVVVHRAQKRHESKYYWVNFHSLLRKEGLEIRLLEGTTSAGTVLWWTRLQHEFIKRVGENKNFYKDYFHIYSTYRSSTRSGREKLFLEFLKPDKELLSFINDREKMHDNSIISTHQPSEETILQAATRLGIQ